MHPCILGPRCVCAVAVRAAESARRGNQRVAARPLIEGTSVSAPLRQLGARAAVAADAAQRVAPGHVSPQMQSTRPFRRLRDASQREAARRALAAATQLHELLMAPENAVRRVA
jgi:hypothetical protein